MLRRRITYQLVLAFVTLAGLGMIITLGTIALVRVSHATLMRVATRAEIAALSARLRSESLALTDIIRNSTLQPADFAAQRAQLRAQIQLLDALVQQAIATTDLNDVEESLRIGQVRQNFIAFTAQAGRVLAAYDDENGFGPQTKQAFTLLVENYQQPLIQALRDFEQLELNQTQIAQRQAEQTIELALGLLMAAVVVAVIAVAVMIGVVLKRIAAPLAKLRAGVEDIRQGRLDQSVAVNSQDEFGELAGAFNMMMAEVRASRRQQEDYARTLEAQVADRTREVERRAQQISTGAEIGRVATRLLDANELIVRVVELIHDRYGFYYVGLFLIDPARHVAVQRYGLDRGGRVFADGTYEWPVGSASIVGQVCAQGEAHIAPDVSRDPWYAPQSLLPDVRSEMALPLRLGERVIGALDVESAALYAFDHGDAVALQGLADQVAIALENARLYGELRTNYERLRALEQLRDDLTRMIVHDLRTPLTSFITGLPLLGELGELNESQRQLLDRVVHGGDTLLGMVNNLLDIARMESGSLELYLTTVTVPEVVGWAVDQVLLLADDRRLRLAQQIAADLPAFQADRDLLRRVLVNLLGNAIRFSPVGGTVVLTVQPAAEAGFIQFTVTDDGPGISRQNFERIFEKFAQIGATPQERKVSTGLGLTFCKLAVEAHGGRIWVESEENRGSAFKFVLPVGRDNLLER